VARQVATARVVTLEAGEQPLQLWWGTPLGGPGLLILSGLVAREVHVADRTATELLGAGDLIRPWDYDAHEPVPCQVVWRVLAAADAALLDDGFAERLRGWPALADALTGRVVQRAQALAVQQAIAAHPRVDMRVAMLLWHLAGRWGVIQGDGSIRIRLPLTHRLLGELVGAERPSVSVALGRLARSGLVSREGPDWCLRGTVDEHAHAACEPVPPRPPRRDPAAV
jgi:hypothetical protein